MKRILSGLAVVLLATVGGSAIADEGMWTMDHLPLDKIQARYGFHPDQAWIDRAQRGALRLARGCSGSFVSADGLVMTNHHCANSCLAQLSAKGSNYMEDGYLAKGAEPRCPDMELNQLQRITDVTDRVNAATNGKNGADRIKAERAIDSTLEKECIGKDAATTRCDVVSLYHGGRYALYQYRRYQDVRMVFAPEQSIAFFGGDPDNFNFPRYDLDLTLVRAYVDGKPARTTDFFQFDPEGPKDGQLTFVVGHPGQTQRQTPWISLKYMRDHVLTPMLAYLSESRGQLWQYSREGDQHAKEAQEELFGIDNGLKVFKGWLDTLSDDGFEARKQREDAQLREWIAADPKRKALYGDPWAKIAQALARGEQLRTRDMMIANGQAFDGELFMHARTLVRAAVERAKPDAERLAPFRDANLPALKQSLSAQVPVYPDFEQTRLTWSLEKMRQALGADDPFVHQVLGKQSPDQRARELVGGTKLADPALRMKLFDGGAKAVDASTDPMIVLARSIDPEARALQKTYEDEVQAPSTQAAEAIAKARFARDGASSYPDATFTLRLSYGKVTGWNENGKPVAPFTDFRGLYARATGADPFKLPASWLKAKDSLDLATPMNFVTDNDIIGGNSGSPVIDKQGHAVGLIFDGNIHSIGGDYTFDASNNRAVAVDTKAIVTALRKIYQRTDLADELVQGHR